MDLALFTTDRVEVRPGLGGFRVYVTFSFSKRGVYLPRPDSAIIHPVLFKTFQDAYRFVTTVLRRKLVNTDCWWWNPPTGYVPLSFMASPPKVALSFQPREWHDPAQHNFGQFPEFGRSTLARDFDLGTLRDPTIREGKPQC